ncbi:hypothetical protein HMI55_001125, partial [Coelomomyces lativittatus]
MEDLCWLIQTVINVAPGNEFEETVGDYRRNSNDAAVLEMTVCIAKTIETSSLDDYFLPWN